MTIQRRIHSLGVGLLVLMLMAVVQPAIAEEGYYCYCDDLCEYYRDCCHWSRCVYAAESNPAEVQVSPLGDHSARISLNGSYALLPEADLLYAAGLWQVPEIRSVDAVKAVNALTGRPIPTVFLNEVFADSFEGLISKVSPNNLGIAEWPGFLTERPNTRVAGFPIKVVFDVSLENGVDLPRLALALQSKGAFISGPANPDGSLGVHRLSLRELKGLKVQIMTERRPAASARPN